MKVGLKSKKSKLITVGLILLLSLFVPVYSYSSEVIEKINTLLPNNVYLDEYHLGGRTLIEVDQYIDEQAQEKLNTKIVVQYDNGMGLQQEDFTLEELGLTLNHNEVKAGIRRILNNEMKLLEKYNNYKSIETEGLTFHLSHEIDRGEFEQALKVFDQSYLKTPIDAKFQYKNGEILIIGGVNGEEFDFDKLLFDIENQVLVTGSQKVKLDTRSVKPNLTKSDLEAQGIKEKVSSYTTRFNSSNVDRTANVRLAGSFINGVIIAPGEVFSFNETVGRRTKERGFREAGIYVNGRLDTGVGGGICQVSTTLYNAVLLADLEIIERSSHSLTVPYVPLSRDAAIDWGSKDLKFRNNTDNYIYIHSQTGQNDITFDLFSTHSNKQVQLISTELDKTGSTIKYIDDPTLDKGKEVTEESGYTGYRSQLMKKVYEKGILIETKVLSTDKYATSPTIIRRGTKAIEEMPIQD